MTSRPQYEDLQDRFYDSCEGMFGFQPLCEIVACTLRSKCGAVVAMYFPILTRPCSCLFRYCRSPNFGLVPLRTFDVIAKEPLGDRQAPSSLLALGGGNFPVTYICFLSSQCHGVLHAPSIAAIFPTSRSVSARLVHGDCCLWPLCHAAALVFG